MWSDFLDKINLSSPTEKNLLSYSLYANLSTKVHKLPTQEVFFSNLELVYPQEDEDEEAKDEKDTLANMAREVFANSAGIEAKRRELNNLIYKI